MRAARYVAPGELELVEVVDPEPATGQLVVEVAMAGICGSDLHALERGYAVRAGSVLGHEFSGRVAAVNEVPDATVTSVSSYGR